MKQFAPNAWKQLKASFKKIMKNEKGQSVDCPFLLNKNRLFQQKFFTKKILRFAQYDVKYSSSFRRIFGSRDKKHNVILRAAPEESVFITKYTLKPPSFFQKKIK